ncbi:MAG: helix-turn-helix domain-containing protein [Methylobacter sp.]|uniref:Helix-turn-helix domain-containing protein n=1 Tax=Candidatus Methylobacter titanis TaxID=3053457 RepID=A0AA43TIS0_9GAMM|nr:helix-turn-helix domain-containing protein [Candidatus Methylobacter titanis]
MKSYQFRFYPTAPQAEQLAREFGCARFVWNQGLIRREYAFQQWGVSLSSAYDISSQITGLKKTGIP